MADHGRNADGATGGIATGNAGTADATRAEPAAAPNVVAFPGDWIGPLDELVPINLEPPEQDSPDASSFWDGDPTAVHEAIGSDAPKAGSARQRVGSTYRPTQPQPSGSGASASSWPPQRRRGPASLLTGGMVFAVLIACLAVVLVLRGGLLHGASKPATGLAKSKTVATKPATTHARSATAKTKPVSVRKRKPLRTRTKPNQKPKPTPELKPKSVTITRHVTVTAQAPVTYTPPPQTVVEVTQPPAPAQHVVTAPAKSQATSHATQTTSCVMSPDSGCLP
jgi:hypothetical protein